MTKTSIFILCFLVPALIVFAGLFFWRSVMVWSGGSFDRLGISWIILKSLWYGAVGVLIAFAIVCIQKESKYFLLPCILAVVLICIDIQFNQNDVWHRTTLDRLIGLVGYTISQVFSHEVKDDPIPTGHRSAIPSNTRIEAITRQGRINIISGNGLRRTYSWDGTTRSIELVPGDQIYGGKDLYYPPARPIERWPGYDWKMHNGITRCRTFEKEQNFTTIQEAISWIQKRQNNYMPYVWSSDGLIIGWSTKVNLDELTVEVTQILVDGKKPSNLPGSDNSKIIITKLRS